MTSMLARVRWGNVAVVLAVPVCLALLLLDGGAAPALPDAEPVVTAAPAPSVTAAVRVEPEAAEAAEPVATPPKRRKRPRVPRRRTRSAKRATETPPGRSSPRRCCSYARIPGKGATTSASSEFGLEP